MQKGTKSKRRKARHTLIILFSILSILLIFISLQMGALENPLEKFQKNEKIYQIKDSCSLIVSQLIHQINNEDDCRIICKARCEVEEMSYEKSEFEDKKNDCNLCSCHCT